MVPVIGVMSNVDIAIRFDIDVPNLCRNDAYSNKGNEFSDLLSLFLYIAVMNV